MSKATATESTPLFSLREVHEAKKQVRAEVLAACINALCCHCSTGHKPDKNGFHFLSRTGYLNERVRCPAFTLHSLQPAAKDLEALLREAELKSLQAIMKKASLPNPLGVGHYVIKRIGGLQR